MTAALRLWGAVLATCPTLAFAVDLQPDAAQLVRQETSPGATLRLPAAPYDPDKLPNVMDGANRLSVYRRTGGALTTLQLVDPLQVELEAAGYKIDYTCTEATCGGFEFRFQLDILGEPDMHVDLGDYRYLLATKSGDGAEPLAVSIVASRDQAAGYLHITEVFAITAEEPKATAPVESSVAAPLAPTGPLIDTLIGRGGGGLDDLELGSGWADVGGGS